MCYCRKFRLTILSVFTDQVVVQDNLDNTDGCGEIESGPDGVGQISIWIKLALSSLLSIKPVYSIQSLKLMLIMLLAAFSGISNAIDVEQQPVNQKSDSTSSLYIGAGIGSSTLKPSTSNSIYSIDEDQDSGYRVYLGYDLNSRLSFEFNRSDLGQATLKPQGSVDYKITMLNVLYYLYDQGERDHVGLATYVKAGVGSIDASATVAVSKAESTQFSVGMGMEYAWENGFAIRGDVESFNNDADLLSVGLLYRFGNKDTTATQKDRDVDGVYDEIDECPETLNGVKVDPKGCELDSDIDGVVDSKDQCLETPVRTEVDHQGCMLDSDNDGVANAQDKCPESKQGVSVDTKGCVLDSDKDGVIDDFDKCPETKTEQGVTVDTEGCSLDMDGDGVVNILDQCPDTIYGADVDFVGCAIFETKIEGVNFKLASAELEGNSKVILDRVATEIIKFPSLIVEIQAHTDSQGTIENNHNLSVRRAESVVKYLVSRDVSKDRLVAKGYGETRPAVSNRTVEGRAKNRRVELRVLSPDAVVDTSTNQGAQKNQDDCPKAESDGLVDSNGCAIFNTKIEGISFQLASLDLTADSKKTLDKVAKSLLRVPAIRIEVQAHTDSQGEIENNQKLSDARAKSVVDYLVSKGVSRERLEAKGFGESQPIVSNRTIEGRAMNRRVEFVMLPN